MINYTVITVKITRRNNNVVLSILAREVILGAC